MAGTPRDDYGDRHIVGAPGCLFTFGAVLPTLWAMWRVFTIAISNSALYGQSSDHTFGERNQAHSERMRRHRGLRAGLSWRR